MSATNEAWEEEQMSNLGCESVSDLIAEVKRLREQQRRILSLAEINLALQWGGDTDISLEWRYVIDLIQTPNRR
ncbi:MAG: hypothetical protein HOC79_05645 [Euryarchaeota archaeon]|jgi:hypothetical protein|nr:hypothetical protein [Euryarchaeota archaeon]